MTNHPFRLQCEQYKLCEIMLDRLGQMANVTIRFDAEVVAAVDHGDTASVLLASGETLRADAVIGTDGAASAVRKSLGVEFDGMTYEDRYLVVSTPFEMADHLDDLAYVNYISDPDEWLVLLRTVDLWRALFPVGEHETDNEALSDQSAQRRLNGVVARKQPYDRWIRHSCMTTPPSAEAICCWHAQGVGRVSCTVSTPTLSRPARLTIKKRSSRTGAVAPPVVRALHAVAHHLATGQRTASMDAKVGLGVDGAVGTAPQHQVVAMHPGQRRFAGDLGPELNGVPVILDEHARLP